MEDDRLDRPDRSEGSEICSLPAPDLRDRITRIREDILPHLRSHETLPGGAAWDFDASPERRAQLEQFVDFERQCCGSLTFALTELPGAKRLRLTVTGEGVQAFAALAGSATASD